LDPYFTASTIGGLPDASDAEQPDALIADLPTKRNDRGGDVNKTFHGLADIREPSVAIKDAPRERRLGT
jgi:hypothetical protein